MRRLAALVVLMGVAGCGDDGSGSSPDGGGADGGPGTARLELSGSCVARNIANSGDPAGIRVDCAVRMEKDGAPVTTGQIRINPAPPAIQTQLLSVETDPSLYTGFYMPYGYSARISASAGDDFLAETVISGPMMFRIERPSPAMPVVSGAPMTVTWERPDPVARVDVVLDSGFETLALDPDPGTTDVPASALQLGSDRVRVTRWRANPLGIGAAPGSAIDFGVETGSTFTVE